MSTLRYVADTENTFSLRAHTRSRTSPAAVYRRLSVYITVVPLSKRINAHHATLICLRSLDRAEPYGVGDSVCPSLPPHVPLSSPEKERAVFTDYLVTGFSVEVLAPPASLDNRG